MLSPKENDIQSDLYYITKKRTTSCFIDTSAFPDSSRASMDDCFCKLAPPGAQTVQRSHH